MLFLQQTQGVIGLESILRPEVNNMNMKHWYNTAENKEVPLCGLGNMLHVTGCYQSTEKLSFKKNLISLLHIAGCRLLCF